MNAPSPFYEESKVINPVGLIVAYLIIFSSTIGLGYLYTMISLFIPIIYFNVLITIGFGILLGYLLRILVRLTHNRHKSSQLILALVTGLFANYFQWVAYLLYAFLGSTPAFSTYLLNLGFIFEPESFFGTMMEINKVGLWSIGSIPINGFMLTLVWIMEFAIIVAIPVLIVWRIKVFPYSEKLGKWYGKYTFTNDFASVSGSQALIDQLTNDSFGTIQNLGRGNGYRHTKLHLYYLENEDKHYLDLERIYIQDQGRGKTNSTIVVDNFKIDTATAKRLLAEFENKRERVEIF